MNRGKERGWKGGRDGERGEEERARQKQVSNFAIDILTKTKITAFLQKMLKSRTSALRTGGDVPERRFVVILAPAIIKIFYVNPDELADETWSSALFF